jgi:hypothetical protein
LLIVFIIFYLLYKNRRVKNDDGKCKIHKYKGKLIDRSNRNFFYFKFKYLKKSVKKV